MHFREFFMLNLELEYTKIGITIRAMQLKTEAQLWSSRKFCAAYCECQL